MRLVDRVITAEPEERLRIYSSLTPNEKIHLDRLLAAEEGNPWAQYEEEPLQFITDALGETGRACLLARHGSVAVGRSVDEALTLTESLEHTAKITVAAYAAGPVAPLDDDTLARLHRLAAAMAGNGQPY